MRVSERGVGGASAWDKIWVITRFRSPGDCVAIRTYCRGDPLSSGLELISGQTAV
ncbi:hypothetical protein BTZ20_0051 [Rhodococcus sp. MTM3W5.2]|nr:hypothetical protein BTZ20_0051 [Rhodococcus sp. MTM3W5.2]